MPGAGNKAHSHSHSAFLSDAKNHDMVLVGLWHSLVAILGTSPTVENEKCLAQWIERVLSAKQIIRGHTTRHTTH